MPKYIGIAALVLLLFGCGEQNGTPIDPGGDDIQVIEKEVNDVEYICFYIYRDGGYDGGPALSCLEK